MNNKSSNAAPGAAQHAEGPAEHPIERTEHPLTRRELLKLGGGAAASAAALAGVASPAVAQGQSAASYAPTVLARASELKTGVPVSFSYPDNASPCVLLKTGSAARAGIGPQQDIVAFSTLCTHRGCPVAYDANARTFKCPCHFSIFDPEKSGQQVCGQATVGLPQIVLDYDAGTDRITAVAVSGLIYGRVANLLEG